MNMKQHENNAYVKLLLIFCFLTLYFDSQLNYKSSNF